MTIELEINSPYPFSLQNTVLSHGWFQLEPWKWESNELVLCRSEKLPNDSFVSIEIKEGSKQNLNITIHYKSSDPSSYKKDIISRITRWLSLEWNPTDAINISQNIDSDIANYLIQGGGRFLRGTTLYEDFLKTMCTVYCSWSRTKQMVKSLYQELGNGSSPTPSQIISAGEGHLSKKLKLGFRSKVIIEATSKLLEENIINIYGQETEETTYKNLLSIKGIGPYTASHVMVLLHDFSRIPIDSEVSNYMKTNYSLAVDQIAEFFNPWKQYKFLGYKIGRILNQI